MKRRKVLDFTKRRKQTELRSLTSKSLWYCILITGM